MEVGVELTVRVRSAFSSARSYGARLAFVLAMPPAVGAGLCLVYWLWKFAARLRPHPRQVRRARLARRSPPSVVPLR